MSYCTKIYLSNGERVDLFTPSMFRVRMPKLETEEIPDIYDIPFSVGKTDDWEEVDYELVEENDFYYLIKTSELQIIVRKWCYDTKSNKIMVKDLNGKTIHPTGENVYGMFSNKCIVFDSATFFGEQTTCDRDSKWFYNKETGLYDIFLEKGEKKW